MRYTKQALSLTEQIAVLKQRGLMIDDEAQAERALEVISYFRLADYWRFMEADRSTRRFRENCHLRDVLAHYHFDKELKILLFSGVQTIEVALRAKMIKHFTPAYSPFWFMEVAYARSEANFAYNLERIRTEIKRSHDDFIAEHFAKYDAPELPPVWKTLEVLSFGMLSKLFCNFSGAAAKHGVAREFGLQHYKFLSSWLGSLTVLRNLCAHHSRIWNRYFPIEPQLPKRMPQAWIADFGFQPARLYPQLCCMAYWLRSIDPDTTFVRDLKSLLAKYPVVKPSLMGFPQGWHDEELWQ